MRKVCTTEYTAARQKRLQESLLALMQTRRYADITVRDLCEAAGIPRRAFYRYFDCKDDVLQALLDEALARQDQIPMKPRYTEKELQAVFEIFFTYWKGQKPLLDALQRSEITGQLLARALDLTMRGESIFRPQSMDQWEWKKRAQFFVAGLFTELFFWHYNHFDRSPQQMARMIVTLLSNPILTCDP